MAMQGVRYIVLTGFGYCFGKKKLRDMDDKEWARINRQACSFIHLCLAKVHKYSIMKETFTKKLWNILKDKYMTKGLENRLYLKNFFFFCF